LQVCWIFGFSGLTSYRNNYKKDINKQVGEEIELVLVNKEGLNLNTFVKANKYHGFALSFGFGKDTPLASAGEKICQNEASVGIKFPKNDFTLYTAEHNYTGELMSHDMSFDGAYDNSALACTMVNDNFVISYGQEVPGEGGTLNFFKGESESMLAQNPGLISGLFTLQIAQGDENVSVGSFELDYNLPVTAEGDLKLPVPAFRPHIDETDRVDYIDVKWYLYSQKTQSYNPVVRFDPYKTMLREVTTGIWIGGDINQEFAAEFNDKYNRIDLNSTNLVWTDEPQDIRLGVNYKVANTYVRFQATKSSSN
jgi:hypothetical protein